jgi:HEAT repeat protein
MRGLRCIVVRYCWGSICVALVALVVIGAQRNPPPNIRVLVDELAQPTTTYRAADKIARIVRKDRAAREYVVHRLPAMIDMPEDDVWLNVVDLAGQIKATEAIPALVRAMSRRPLPAKPYITFGGLMRLDNDIVAKTLSQMGDPAIPSALDFLKSADKGTRGRAVLILANISSPAARKALQDYLPQETDEELRKVIQNSLGP